MLRRLACALCAFACAVPVFAIEGESRFRFGALYVSPTGDLSAPQALDLIIPGPNGDFPATIFVDSVLEADDGLGFELGFEHRATSLIGVEFTLARVSHDVDLEVAGTRTTIADPLGNPGDTVTVTVPASSQKFGDITQTPINIGLNFHLLKDAPVDLYVGPNIGYTLWNDLEVENSPVEISIDDEFTYGAQVGLDVPFGDTWAFNVQLRYRLLEAAAEDDSEGDDVIEVDPAEARVGFAVRF